VDELFPISETYLLGGVATHPIARLQGALASLLVVAGGDPAASSRLAITPRSRTLRRVQLTDLG